MLSVRNGARAIDFYKAAFGAAELFLIDDQSGAVVARLSVGEAEFWVADESPEHQNFSPATLGGGTGADGDDRGRSGCRVRTGRRGRRHRGLARRKPVWLALRANRRSVWTPLGNRQALVRTLHLSTLFLDCA